MKNSRIYKLHQDVMATPLDPRAKHLRKQIIRMMAAGQRGHVGAAFSLIDILRVLYNDILHYEPRNPTLPDRDRFILSKGHGCLAQYVLLAEKGFIAESDLWQFCKEEGILGGHPDYHKVPGIEASTGSLGHGLALAVGMALNAKYEYARYGIYVVVGDGECNEGSIWETAMCAAKYKLDNLTVLIDYNKMQSYDYTEAVQDLEPFADKWRSFGFATVEINGHDITALQQVLGEKPEVDKPKAIICHTVKGKGIAFAENNLLWHHQSRVSSSDIETLLQAIEEYPCAAPA